MKKFISIFLTTIFLFSLLSMQALANDESSIKDTDYLGFVDEVKNKSQSLLGAMERYKAYYGLADANFSDMSLGAEIPVFEFTADGLEKLDSLHFFPIISAGEWVATATVTYSELGDMNVEISAKLADDYNALAPAAFEEGVAVVYDNTKEYLYIGSQPHVVETYEAIFDRASMSSYSRTIMPATVELQTEESLTITPLIQTRAAGDSVFLNVPAIKQPTSTSCWAASIASILNYYGESQTVASVCSRSGFGQNTYQNAATAASIIGNVYGYGWGRGKDNNYQYTTLIMDTLITETYLNSSPIFAGFKNSGSKAGHAVVVQGYVNIDNLRTMSYMDPADAYYKASTVPSNGKVTINNNGVTQDLLSAFAVYD